MNDLDYIEELQAKGVELLEFMYVDYTGIPRAKAMFLDSIGTHLSSGMGITKAMMASTLQDSIVDYPELNAVGEFRLIPDIQTIKCLPYQPQVATAVCEFYDYDTRSPLDLDSRFLLKKVISSLKNMGYDALVSLENEFTIYKKDENGKLRKLDDFICFSTESNEEIYDIILEIAAQLRAAGIKPLEFYHEAGVGQQELPIEPTDPVKAADNEIMLKRIVKKAFNSHGYYATFAPKPNLSEAGSGAHLHVSLWKDGRNAFLDENNGRLSQVAKYFIGGVLKHINAILAFTCPSENSYQRLKPSNWSSDYAIWGIDNREAAVRIPSTFWNDEESTLNVELKSSDGTANPYLAIAAVISAGIDGIKGKMVPPEEIMFDPQKLSKSEREERGIFCLPRNLEEAISALKQDDYLKECFSSEFVDLYSQIKESELLALRDFSSKQISDYFLKKY